MEFVTDDQLLSPYQCVTSVRMYFMCGVFVKRQIGPAWGLVKAKNDTCLDMCHMPLGHRGCVSLV